jgi:hypothetical protein
MNKKNIVIAGVVTAALFGGVALAGRDYTPTPTPKPTCIASPSPIIRILRERTPTPTPCLARVPQPLARLHLRLPLVLRLLPYRLQRLCRLHKPHRSCQTQGVVGYNTRVVVRNYSPSSGGVSLTRSASRAISVQHSPST